MADSQASGRRSALQRIGGLVVGVLGAALGVALLTPALIAVTDPLRRRRRQAARQVPRVKVADVGEIPNLDAGAPPLRAPVVVSGLRDAWNRLDSTRVGSVFLGTQKGALTCLSAICPHAGCGIDFDDKKQKFVCPCHNSTFAIDGRREEGPSPRDMDRLDVSVEGDGVYCSFQRFRLAMSNKVPV
jgi:menaquinol-cytochrome c reductase iron-sulfur subunit